jgi:hypothetical protein
MKRALLFAALTGIVVLGSTLTLAQTQPHGARPGQRRRPKADAGAVSTEDASTDPVPHGELPVARVPGHLGDAPKPPGSHPAPASSNKDVLEARTLDGGAHVFRFGEIEIEGRLQSPQLVYFLRRVRAEFAAGDLGHRSFLREMSDTRRDPAF